MYNIHTKDLKPLDESIPTLEPKLWKLGNTTIPTEEWEWVEDEAYATPRAMIVGLLLGFLSWGVVFFFIWLFLWR